MMADLSSDAGKEMLAYASAQDYCVIEFKRHENGQLILSDISDHVREMEKRLNDEDPHPNPDNARQE